jgi:phosphoribosylamine--glycine ligase
MLTGDGPRLLEFNARFGDPETQAILPRLAVPLGPLLLAAARGGLDRVAAPATLPGATCAIVLAGAGYPGAPTTGDRIEGLGTAGDEPGGALVFHAATRHAATAEWTAAGGRVLTVVGRGADLATAARSADAAADRITWPGLQRRHDIGLTATTGAAR